jgi:hypothetical protein
MLERGLLRSRGREITLPDDFLERFLDRAIMYGEEGVLKSHLETLQLILHMIENKRTVILNDEEIDLILRYLHSSLNLPPDVESLKQKESRTPEEEKRVISVKNDLRQIIKYVKIMSPCERTRCH